MSPVGAFDKIAPINNVSLNGMWSTQTPAGVHRRNSTSSVSSSASIRNRMNMNSLTSVANIIPETATITAAAATIFNSVSEERFRSRAYSEGASSLSIDQQQPQQQPLASSRYKTELCRPFEENGKCKYGDKCQFAHGKQELRQLIRHPKYKTELCRRFHTSGLCPYGPRCDFIHNQEDLGNRMPTNMQSSSTMHQTSHQTAYNHGISSQPGMPIPVPSPHVSERNHFNHRPSQLTVLTKQLSCGPILGGMSYSPTNQSPGGSPTFYQRNSDLECSTLLSPTSPNAGKQIMFNFNVPTTNSLMYEQSTPPMSNYDMFSTQGCIQDAPVADDAFSSPPTPPDSDRESMTGSPPSRQQRLPIFRCLSQSD